MPEVPPSVTNYGVSEASDAQGLEHTYALQRPAPVPSHSTANLRLCVFTRVWQSSPHVLSSHILGLTSHVHPCRRLGFPLTDVPRFKTKYAPIFALEVAHAKYQGADFLLDSHPISAPRHLPAQLVCNICCT